jgi:hypothetical protein
MIDFFPEKLIIFPSRGFCKKNPGLIRRENGSDEVI